jgi:hypothetical protein
VSHKPQSSADLKSMKLISPQNRAEADRKLAEYNQQKINPRSEAYKAGLSAAKLDSMKRSHSVEKRLLKQQLRMAQQNLMRQQVMQQPQVPPQIQQAEVIAPPRPTQDQLNFPSYYLSQENKRLQGFGEKSPLDAYKRLWGKSSNGNSSFSTGFAYNGSAYRDLFSKNPNGNSDTQFAYDGSAMDQTMGRNTGVSDTQFAYDGSASRVLNRNRRIL